MNLEVNSGYQSCFKNIINLQDLVGKHFRFYTSPFESCCIVKKEGEILKAYVPYKHVALKTELIENNAFNSAISSRFEKLKSMQHVSAESTFFLVDYINQEIVWDFTLAERVSWFGLVPPNVEGIPLAYCIEDSYLYRFVDQIGLKNIAYVINRSKMESIKSEKSNTEYGAKFLFDLFLCDGGRKPPSISYALDYKSLIEPSIKELLYNEENLTSLYLRVYEEIENVPS
jgi:hypothetical protein